MAEPSEEPERDPETGKETQEQSADQAPPKPLAAPVDPELQPFYDVPIEISVQLDRKWIKLREVLGLQPDSIIAMERSAGENVDLLFDGLPAGSGEIVVIDNMMGLRITDFHAGRRRRNQWGPRAEPEAEEPQKP